MNKTKNDTCVVEHLEEIKKLLPTLDVWRDIYPNRTMRDLVAEAYHQVLGFARAATEYLTRFWRVHPRSSYWLNQELTFPVKQTVFTWR